MLEFRTNLRALHPLNPGFSDLIVLALITGLCVRYANTIPASIETAKRIVFRLSRFFGILVLLSLCCGCQSINPFGHSVGSLEQAQAHQWTRGGLDALAKGRLDQAKRYFNRAQRSFPKDPEIEVNLARTLVRQGDLDGAVQGFERAIANSNDMVNNVVTHVELGEVYLAKGQWLHARRQADLALDQDRHYPEAWVLRGKTEYAKGNWPNALFDFQRALRYQPKMPDVQIQIAETYQKMGQPIRALSTAEQILSQYPLDRQPERAKLAKAVSLITMQHYDSAIDVLQVASLDEDASSEVYVRLGQAQLLAGQTSQARMTLNRAMQIFPDQQVLSELVSDLRTASQDVASVTR